MRQIDDNAVSTEIDYQPEASSEILSYTGHWLSGSEFLDAER